MHTLLRPHSVALGLLLGIALAGCQAPPESPSPPFAASPKSEIPMANLLDLLPNDSDWALVSATAAGLDRPEAKAVQLHIAPTRLSGTGGCNQFSAGYQILDKRLVVGYPAATKMGCPGPVGEVEQALFALLPTLSSASMEGADLILRSEDGASLRFSRVEPASK